MMHQINTAMEWGFFFTMGCFCALALCAAVSLGGFILFERMRRYWFSAGKCKMCGRTGQWLMEGACIDEQGCIGAMDKVARQTGMQPAKEGEKDDHQE